MMPGHAHAAIFEETAVLRRATMEADAICFFGLGALFKACFGQLVLATGRAPDVLCDNAPQKWGQTFFGVPCISPGQLAGYPKHILTVICTRNYEQAAAQLTALGFNNIFLAHFERGYHRLRSIKRNDAQKPHGVATGSSALSLRGKWALITGATRGIGRQIAIALAQQGVNVIVHGRSLDNTVEVAQSCRALEVETLSVAADLGNSEELEALIARLQDNAQPIDLLFNNAGISPSNYGGFWQMPIEAFHTSYAVNVMAPIRLCQQLIPGMKKRGFGRIVNVSSSIQKRPGEMAYACSKAALDKFVFDLKSELGGSGVMMSLLDPGWLRTDMGGAEAAHAVESVLPGALLGALIDGDVNGSWFSAQDYVGMSIDEAIWKAFFIGACAPHQSAIEANT